jgi:hypothetical protein
MLRHEGDTYNIRPSGVRMCRKSLSSSMMRPDQFLLFVNSVRVLCVVFCMPWVVGKGPAPGPIKGFSSSCRACSRFDWKISPPLSPYPLLMLVAVVPSSSGSRGCELMALFTGAPAELNGTWSAPVPMRSISRSIGKDMSRSRGFPKRSDWSRSDRFGADPGSWFAPPPCWYMDMAWYNRDLARALSHCGQATNRNPCAHRRCRARSRDPTPRLAQMRFRRSKVTVCGSVDGWIGRAGVEGKVWRQRWIWYWSSYLVWKGKDEVAPAYDDRS